MARAPTWLLEYRRNVHSQAGEDGVIEKILETLPSRDKWCVEFGAWDGLYLTNTRHLIESQGYSAVLIEGSTERFAQLQRNYADRKSVITRNAFVGFTPHDGLDQLLRDTPIPEDFDLLSIDIDGNDYHVWKATETYRPKVVVIEFNPTIPTPVEFVQPADPAVQQGASLRSIVQLGRDKGYELVSVLPFNAMFVRREYFAAFGIESNTPETMRTDESAVTWLFTGYDGHLFLRGSRHMPWHDLPLKESRLQALPAFLQKFPDNYSRLQRFVFRLLRK